ncbi:MAG: hypothetical protein H6623_04980 [Bdellovibrionaceae bacterium]|nr:hypothetical protein [Pseudobdellovibrionaceae bacterium]
MLRSLLSAIIIITLCSCGKEQGVPARIRQKTLSSSQALEQQALGLLGVSTKTDAYFNSLSSQSIRNDTLGFRVESKAKADGSLDFTIEHYETFDQNKCRDTSLTVNIPANKIDRKWNEISTLKLMCFDGSCSSLLMVIKQSSSSFADANGNIVSAYVPVLLQTNNPVGGSRLYIPVAATNPIFLQFKDSYNTICGTPENIVRIPTQIAIDPTDGLPVDPNYVPYDPNNTWIY